MKPFIIVLATLGGIGLGIAEAAAADNGNLSCITETTADGKIVRDCGPEPKPYLLLYAVSESSPPPTPPTFAHDGGGKKSDANRRGERGGTIR